MTPPAVSNNGADGVTFLVGQGVSFPPIADAPD